jgi:hypothetical protein
MRRGVPYRGEHCQADKRAAADIEGHSEAAKFGQPGRLNARKPMAARKRQQSLVILFDCLLLSFELHYCGFDVLASRAFEGAEIETRFFRLNARQIHLRRVRRAFWTIWPRSNWRVFEGVFGKRHLRLLLLQAGALPNSQPPTPDLRPLSVMHPSLGRDTKVSLSKIEHSQKGPP